MQTMTVPYAISSYTLMVHEAEEGGYWGEILELPGCVSQGETKDELRGNIREALEAVLESESQGPDIRIYVEPILAEKDFLEFSIPESCGEKAGGLEVPQTWTATA